MNGCGFQWDNTDFYHLEISVHQSSSRVSSWCHTPFPSKPSARSVSYFNSSIPSDKASPSALLSNYKCRKHNSQSNHIKRKENEQLKCTFCQASQPSLPSHALPTTALACSSRTRISPGPPDTRVLLISLAAAFQLHLLFLSLQL